MDVVPEEDSGSADMESSPLAPALAVASPASGPFGGVDLSQPMVGAGSSTFLNKSVRFPEQLVAEVPFVKTLNTLETQRTRAPSTAALLQSCFQIATPRPASQRWVIASHITSPLTPCP
jgi:hypothetical protein